MGKMQDRFGKVGRYLPVTLLEVEGCSITTLAILEFYIRHVQHYRRSFGSQQTSINLDWTEVLVWSCTCSNGSLRP